MPNILKRWLKSASNQEIQQLADQTRTTVGYLRLVAYAHCRPSLDLVIRIENVSKLLTNDRLPVITRGDLSPDCAQCPYYNMYKENE